MRLDTAEHTSRPWAIHRIAPDFTVEDLWALPTPGGPDEFPRLLETLTAGSFPDDAPRIVRFLWNARWRLGAVLGWDREKDGLGTRVASLRDRLPEELRDGPTGPSLQRFDPLYLGENEWAAEMANRTVHTVMHLSWVPDDTGGHHGRMAVLVKPNGWFGAVYMAAIKPFRHLLVYPALMRSFDRRWRASA
ncbi:MULTISPECIES: DUF2867 domain-containing protein [Nocardiopsis]|uniref:DUF2867 domain-containing protein n=1 Tax=Nocardiopsis TaxID=2013 RepID=UPI0003485060|nr:MULTISPECIES: DUF2867 domain-containing protein [Nocardiopsis]